MELSSGDGEGLTGPTLKFRTRISACFKINKQHRGVLIMRIDH